MKYDNPVKLKREAKEKFELVLNFYLLDRLGFVLIGENNKFERIKSLNQKINYNKFLVFLLVS